MVNNRFKSFLAEKEKDISEASQYSNSEGGSGNTKKKYFSYYFQPNKMFIGRSEVVVQVLPNGEQFFYEYNKHNFIKNKDGVYFKPMVCLDENCPLCNCIKDNQDRLDKKTMWMLSPKKVDLMFIYNPYAKQIQQYEVTAQGIVDIIKPLNEFMDNNPDFDPDKTGFNIVFKQTDKYAKCVAVELPSLTVDEVLKEATNREDAIDEDGFIRSLETVAVPFSINTTRKYNNTTAQQILNEFLPGVNAEPYFYEIQDYQQNNENKSKTSNDNNTKPVEEPPIVDTDTLSVPNDNDGTTNNDTEDIRAFLNNRRRRS